MHPRLLCDGIELAKAELAQVARVANKATDLAVIAKDRAQKGDEHLRGLISGEAAQAQLEARLQAQPQAQVQAHM